MVVGGVFTIGTVHACHSTLLQWAAGHDVGVYRPGPKGQENTLIASVPAKFMPSFLLTLLARLAL